MTLVEADFSGGATAHFGSTAVKHLTFESCLMDVLPPLTGFPNLRALELVECVFRDDTGAVMQSLLGLPLEHLRVEKCEGKLVDASPIGAMPQLKTLVMHECVGGFFPEFDAASAVVMKAKILSGEVTAGCLCKVLVRRLDIRRAERESIGLVQCECCGPCACGECSDCE